MTTGKPIHFEQSKHPISAVNGTKFDSLIEAAEHLEEIIGGKTITNYIPVRDSILVYVTVKIAALQVVACETTPDLLRLANNSHVAGTTPGIAFQIAAVSNELKDKLPLGAYIDIKALNFVVTKNLVKDSVDIDAYLRKFKEDNPALLAGVSQAINAQNKKKNSTLILPERDRFTIDGTKNRLEADQMVEIGFYGIMEFHNVAGIYIKPENIAYNG